MALLRKGLSWLKLRDALTETALVTATIFLVVIGAMIFSRFLAVSTLPMRITETVVTSGIPPLAMIFMFMLLYIAMGTILDSMAMMLITLPILHPLIVGMGMDPIWFAMCVIMAIEVGILTPPFGLSVYALKASIGDRMALESL